MTSTCTFAPTTVLPTKSQCFLSKRTHFEPICDINSGRKVIGVVSSWITNMHNSLLCLHNSDLDEHITSAKLTITACEEFNMPKEQNLIRLDEIAKLEENWNGYGAKAFSQELIGKCKDIINNLEFQPKIFPTGRKSVQFQYELEDRSYLEFEIFEDKVSCLEVPKRIYSNAHTFEFPISEAQRIEEIVKKFYGQDGSTE